MIEILFIFESTPMLRDEGDLVVEKNDDPLQPGNYYVTGGFISFYLRQLLILKKFLLDQR